VAEAKAELQGEAMVHGAIHDARDPKHGTAFHTELDSIDPSERAAAFAAAQKYETKCETTAAQNHMDLPKVTFFESAGQVGQVVVTENGKAKEVYNAANDGQKSKVDQAKDGAVNVGKKAGAAITGIFHRPS
jgi:hypothetical protein